MLFVVGWWSADKAETILKQKDPKQVVVDEVVGQWITLLAVTTNPFSYLFGFAFFRVFDILKPFPVSWADRQLKGGLGIMLDDVLAGIYGAISLYYTSRFLLS